MHDDALPVLIEVIRGNTTESRHAGVAVVCDARGTVMWSLGDPGLVMFPRSAIKPIQSALVMAESGAMQAFDVSPQELALACASHAGDPIHTDPVRTWLSRIGLEPSNLECGPQDPRTRDVLRDLLRAGCEAGREHNNCSGKHTGFLTICRHMGVDPAGYPDADHPAQAAVCRTMAEMCDTDHATADLGTDGCGVPSIAMPLVGLATGMARLADPSGLSHGRAQACRAIVAAMAAHPLMIAGAGRTCSVLNRAGKGRFVVKGGAEGVYAAAWPGKGWGIALKIADGAGRAAEVAVIHVLRHIGAIDDATWQSLAAWRQPQQHNWAGTRTGELRAAGTLSARSG
ncbi:MAG: asparaginase [Rhodospirillales bacterium]|nr:asparaginase [Rhodospirillales bacterium]